MHAHEDIEHARCGFVGVVYNIALPLIWACGARLWPKGKHRPQTLGAEANQLHRSWRGAYGQPYYKGRFVTFAARANRIMMC